MHKFLRAAGFSMYTKKKDIEKLLDLLERQPSMTKCVQVDEDDRNRHIKGCCFRGDERVDEPDRGHPLRSRLLHGTAPVPDHRP